jgi:hypothetical protein
MSDKQFNNVNENAVNGGETKKDVRDMERKQRDAREAGKAIVKNWVFWGLVIAVLFLGFFHFQQSAEISALKMAVGGIEKNSDEISSKEISDLVSKISFLERKTDGLKTISAEDAIKEIVQEKYPSAKIISTEKIAFYCGIFGEPNGIGDLDPLFVGFKKSWSSETSFIETKNCFVYSDYRWSPAIYGEIVDTMIHIVDKQNNKRHILIVYSSENHFPSLGDIKILPLHAKIEE